jgi:peptide/nickel transport system permease protein
VNYWGSIFSRDLGVSLVDFPQPVVEKIQSAVPWTLALLSVSTVISFFLGSILGALIAWPRAPRFLHVLVPPFMLLSSVPFFLLGIVLLFTFSVIVPWFPPGGGFDPVSILRLDVPTAIDLVYHAILPSMALVLGSIGFWGLGMRAMMVSVLGEDHITFAESKGLPPERVFLWYGMRNALLPQITSLAIALGSILSGAVLVEVIFNYPGLGGILFLAIAGKDYFVIQGIVLMLILALAISLFVVDLIYPLVDPRIRYHA